MKDFIFANENDTFGLEFKTDHLDNFDNFTVHDIIFDGKDSDLTLNDIVRAGLNYERLPYTKAAFKKYAEDNNYKLTELDNIAQDSTVLNTPIALNITTTTIKDGVINETYDEQIEVEGGNTPYSYALTSNGTTDLPAGLTFNIITGKLEGAPTEAKASAVLDVTVTDVFGVSTDDQFTFVITV